MVIYDDPFLRKKAAKVTAFDAALKKLAAEMIEMMHAKNGIGLAAEQIGSTHSICVVDVSPRKDDEDPIQFTLDGKELPLSVIMPLVLVNPVLKLDKTDLCTYNEGCLSIPGVYAEVERPERLSCRYMDLDGDQHTLVCDGILARCIQHEVDHLSGILFIDRLSKSALKKIWPELEKVKTEQATRVS